MLDVPAGDVLIHAGDVSAEGEQEVVLDFMDWMSSLPHRYKLFIAGNHDRFIEQAPHEFQQALPLNIHYLEDSGIEIGGIKIWGSPMTPAFYDWAFMKEIGPPLSQHWALIPDDTHILVTHGPPYGIMDEVILPERREHAGCPDLLKRIMELKPDIHIFGHIHEAYGNQLTNGVQFMNVSTMNQQYQIQNAIVEFEYEAP